MLVVVTGGSGSGKSAFAEDRVLSFWRVEKDLYCHHAGF